MYKHKGQLFGGIISGFTCTYAARSSEELFPDLHDSISHALISDSVLNQELTRTPLGCRALWGYKHKGAVSTVVVVA